MKASETNRKEAIPQRKDILIGWRHDSSVSKLIVFQPVLERDLIMKFTSFSTIALALVAATSGAAFAADAGLTREQVRA